MNEKDIVRPNDRSGDQTPEIVVNETGPVIDPAVVVDAPGRTVLLTPDETLIIEKEPEIDIVPIDRPRRVYAGMWGTPELITVGLGVFAAVVVILIYFFLVLPSNRELASKRADSERLRYELETANSKYGEISDTKEHVAKLVSSVENFEATNLPPVATGRNSLYQRLNGLMAAYGLVNTNGPDYAPLETTDQGSANESDAERGRARFRSLFPGVYVTVTLEGSYQNLRRFIREVETGREFVIVSAVELEPSESESGADVSASGGTTGATAQPNPNIGPVSAETRQMTPRGKTHGEVVALRLEMAAYFRRPGFSPAVVLE